MARPPESTEAYKFNVRPDFSSHVVERYPSLTMALADSYPRPRTPPRLGTSAHFSDPDVLKSSYGISMSITAPTIYCTPFTHPTASTDSTFFDDCVPIYQDLNKSSSNTTNDQRFPSESPTPGKDFSSDFSADLSPIFQDPYDISNNSLENSPLDNFISISKDSLVTPSNEGLMLPSLAHMDMALAREPRALRSCAAVSHDTPVAEPPNISAKKNGHKKSDKMKGDEKKSGKRYTCSYDSCEKSFVRPCQLLTHQNTHTRAQPYSCGAPECSQKFGVRSNMLRHQAKHGIPRTGNTKPIQHFEGFSFEEAIVSTVHSDLSPMGFRAVMWDRDGPLSRRKAE
ncbi:hypothetical protein FB451DRAFT_240889 [Mycena latifolia]|nr:hypothetical protein FB451DRAFT_240889 [Mycena latifolia]